MLTLYHWRQPDEGRKGGAFSAFMTEYMPYIVHVPVLALLIYLLERSVPEHPLRYFFYPALLLKLLAGVVVGYMYYLQPGDSQVLFGAAMELLSRDFPAYVDVLLWQHTDSAITEPRVLYMAKWISVVAAFSLKNYWITSAYFSLLSFAAFWYFSRVLLQKFHGIRWPVLIAFFLFPSVVFSTSGILKEPLALSIMVVIMALVVQGVLIKKRINWWHILLMVVLFYVLGRLKYYYLGALLPVVLAYAGTVWLKRRWLPATPAYAIGTFLVLFAGLLLAASQTHPNLRPDRFMEALVQNHDTMLENTTSWSLIYYHDLQPTPGSFLHNAPEAFISGLFRPFIWEIYKPNQFVTGVENFIILFFSLAAFYLFAVNRFRGNLLVWAVLLYIFFLATLLALSSPNWGTLDRYKVAFKPFLLLLIFIPTMRVMTDLGDFFKKKES